MFNEFKAQLISISLSLFIVAGAFRALFGIDQKIYFILTSVLFFTFFLSLLQVKNLPKKIRNYVILGVIFFLWLILSSTWTISEAQWKKDLILVLGLLILIILIPYILNFRVIELVKKYTVLFCSVVAFLAIYYSGGILNIKGYGTLINEFYLTAANPIAVAFIISIIQLYFYNSRRIFWLALSFFFMVALGISLSRGAIIFSFLIIFSLVIFNIKIKLIRVSTIKKYLLRYLVFILPLLFGLIVISFNVERTKTRLIRMISVKQELSTGGRGALWKDSLEGIADSPFIGYGLGGNGLIIGSDTNYPHNLFLQIWLDGGILAFVFGLVFLCYPIYLFLKNIKTTKYDPNSLLTFFLYIYYFLNYSKSGNFYTARELIIFGALLNFCIIFTKTFKSQTVKSLS